MGVTNTCETLFPSALKDQNKGIFQVVFKAIRYVVLSWDTGL